MYKHCDSNDDYISLHDCHVTKVTYDNDVLTFVFEDGIWITHEHQSNTSNKTVRTDIAEVNFTLESGDPYDVTLYIFEKKFNKTVRKEWDLYELIESINSGKTTLEFLYEYKGFNSMIIECWMWSEKKPYHKECQLKLSVTNVNYCWNNLCEDREW